MGFVGQIKFKIQIWWAVGIHITFEGPRKVRQVWQCGVSDGLFCFVFLDRISLCIPGCLGTHYID